jgi:hypothetical protein
MKKSKTVSLIIFIGVVLFPNLFLSSCFSFVPTPIKRITYGEGENELHGTSWISRYGNNLIEYLDFHDGGRYLWRQNLGTAATGYRTDENRGTYIIEGNKLILIREGAIRIVATFSGNRQSFSYYDRVFELSTVRRTYSYPVHALIVENIPSGDFVVGVYSGNSVPQSRTEFRNMTDDKQIGGGSGNSPFEIKIFASIQTAPRLISIISEDVSNARFSVVEFTDGATIVVDWNNMIDYYSLSR